MLLYLFWLVHNRWQLFDLVFWYHPGFLAKDRRQSLSLLLHSSQIFTRTFVQSLLYQHGLERLSLDAVISLRQKYRFIFDQQFLVTPYPEGARMSL